jgi:hypothetical protein
VPTKELALPQTLVPGNAGPPGGIPQATLKPSLTRLVISRGRTPAGTCWIHS